MTRFIGQALLVAVACAGFGSFAYGGEAKAGEAAEKGTAKVGDAAEKAGDKVGEAADATAAAGKKVGHAVKRGTKKALKATGAALDGAGNKIEN